MDSLRKKRNFNLHNFINHSCYIPGKAKQVTVNRHGNCYVLDSRKLIYRYTGKSWVQFPGFADYISIADDGLLWGVYHEQVFVYKRFWVNQIIAKNWDSKYSSV